MRARVPLVLSALFVAAPAALAASPFYKCVKDGRTTYSDEPCQVEKVPAPAAPDSAARPGPAPLLGLWRGQAQFQFFQEGTRSDEAHAVIPITLSAADDGKVSGASPDNGCRLLGLWSPGIQGQFVSLDITLSSCRFEGLNRRYYGQLSQQGPGRAELTLHSTVVPLQKPANGEVRATLRR